MASFLGGKTTSDQVPGWKHGKVVSFFSTFQVESIGILEGERVGLF